MNRQQRRQAAKESKQQSPKEVSTLLKREKYVGVKEAVYAMAVVIAYELHRRGWKKRSIVSMINKINGTFDAITRNYTNLGEIEQVLKEELDLQL